MTLAKTQIKRDAFNQVGNRLDDMLEDIEKAKLKAEGASVAVSGLSTKVEALYEYVNKDLDEGVIKDIAVAKLVKTYITRALDICGESSKAADRTRLKLSAKAEGISASLFEVKKLFDHEDATLRQAIFLARNAEDAPKSKILDTTTSIDDRRPSPSIKAQRQAEEIIQKIEETTTETEKTEEVIGEEPDPVVVVEPEEEVVVTPDPMEEIHNAQNQAKRADGRFQCGSCKRHFKDWASLIEHCAEEEHSPRSSIK